MMLIPVNQFKLDKSVFFLVACWLLMLTTSTIQANTSLSLSINGRTQPYLTSMAGGAIGVNPVTMEFEETLTNATIEIKADLSNIELLNPAPGTYSVILGGAFEDALSISIGYYDDVDGLREQQTAMALHHGFPLEFSIDINPSQEPVVQLISQVGVPVSPKVEDMGGIALLAWDDPLDPAITAYRIYGRLEEIPKFQLLGETSFLSFSTGHAARTDDTGDHWQYVVLARNAAGDESLYDLPLTNLVRLLPVFSATPTQGELPLAVSYADYSLGNPSAWAWDFDGDGIVDSTEQNPAYTYTQTGVYDVTLEVVGAQGVISRTERNYISAYVDTDGDDVPDHLDNCVLQPNGPTQQDTSGIVQLDTDGDGYGNLCDADIFPLPQGDGFVDFADLTQFSNVFFTADTDADFDGSGFVDFNDLTIFSSLFFQTPGPSCCGTPLP